MLLWQPPAQLVTQGKPEVDFSHERELTIGREICVRSHDRVIFLGRLPKVDLIILEGGGNVRPYVRPSVRPSAKSFFDFNEIWYIGRGR